MPKLSDKRLKRINEATERGWLLWRRGKKTTEVLDILELEYPEMARRTLKNYLFGRAATFKTQLTQ